MTVATRKQRRQQVVVDNSWEDPHSAGKRPFESER